MKKALNRFSAVTAGVLGLSLALGACSAQSSTETENSTADTTAQSSEALVVYSGRSEDLVAPLIAKFTEETGIEVEVRYGKTAEQAQLLLTEGENTPAQVFLSQEAGALGLVGQAGMLAELPTDVLSQVPAVYSSENKEWVGVTGRARVVAYNEATVTADEAPDTIAEMIDPKWAGRIGIAPTNASFLSFVTAIRNQHGEEYAKDWLAKLAANGVKTYDKNTAVLDAVEAGEVDLGLINHYYWYSKASEIGAENMNSALKYGQSGDEAALVNVTGVGILKQAAENSNALEFVKFMLSDSAQEYFAAELYEYPLIEGIAAPAGVPALDPASNGDLDLSDLGTVDETAALIDAAGLSVQ